MRLAIVGKYPPIQGGVSRSVFWMAHALAEHGIDVHVITNAMEVEPEFRIFELGAWEPGLKLADEPRAQSGKVVVHSTSDSASSYIPSSNPFVTKLAAKTAAVVDRHHCSLIHGSYWEPYGMAAHLASTWTGVPFGLQHAGSDVGRLFLLDDMKEAYRRMLAAADYMVLSAQTCALTQKLGLDPSSLYPLPAAMPPENYFSPATTKLDLPLALRCVREYFRSQSTLGPAYAEFAEHDYDPDRPTIGIFGKLGSAKGVVQLIAALGTLRERGVPFNFVVMGQARQADFADFVSWLDAFQVRESTFLLPFLPHWQVPHFIRACDVVCVLEKGFPIAFHTPLTAMEVVACGTCLLMSDEIAEKQSFRNEVKNGENAFVANPMNSSELVDTLQAIMSDRQRAAEVGRLGAQELAVKDPPSSYGTKVATRFIQIEREVRERGALESLARDIAAFDRVAESAGAPSPELSVTRRKLEANYRAERLPHLFHAVCDAFSMTHRVLRRELRRHFTDFYLGAVVPHSCSTTTAVLALADYLREAVPADQNAPAYTSEVLQFELTRYRLKWCEPRGPVRPGPDSRPVDDCRPLPTKGLTLQESTYDLPRIFEWMRSTTVDDDPPPETEFSEGKHCFAFKRVHQDELDPEAIRVSPGSQSILAACDGKRTVEEIVDRVLKDHPTEPPSSVLKGLEQLWAAAYLERDMAQLQAAPLKLFEEIATRPAAKFERPHAWRSLGLCANAYPKRVVQILMSRNTDRAHFKLREEAGGFLLRYKPVKDGYGEGEILDELNYLCFAETQREIAEPIRREIVSGLVRKFGGDEHG